MKLRLFGSLAVLFPFILTGCKVDDSYDLNNLDTESSVMKGIEFPIGSLRRITLEELFNLKETEYFFADGNGDYRIHVPFEDFGFDVSLPLDQDLLPESGTSFVFEYLPEFLSDDSQPVNMNLELSDVEISIGIDSGLPVTASVSTSVDLLRAGSVTHHYGVDGLQVVPGLNSFAFNESGSGSLEGVQYKAVTGLGEFFSPVPDQLIVNDFRVDIPESDGTGTFPVSCSLTADSPVAFTASSACKVSIPVDAELNLTQIGLKKAVLTMDVYNSVPLEFKLSAYALDGNGDRLQGGITASTDVPVAAGTTQSPAHTLLHVTFTAEDLRFQGLILELEAVSNERVAGVPLNRNQGLELKNLVLSLPDGIIVSGK